MEIKLDSQNSKYQNLVAQISEAYAFGYKKAVAAVNSNMVETNWKIGQYIIEFEQGGSTKAKYGKAFLENLSKDLTRLHGKGFSCSNRNDMSLFYQRFPICETLSHKLSWSHICELLKINDPLERSFYEKQTAIENWNVRELWRQKNTSLYLRLAASKDKESILQLAKQGQVIQKPIDIIRDPCLLEFIKIPESYLLSETDLEARQIDHLQHFFIITWKRFCFYWPKIPHSDRKPQSICRFGLLPPYSEMFCIDRS